jgi:type IV pilus assembly protein PilC
MRLSPKDKQAMIASLATMLTSGIPILEAVDTLLEDSKGPTQKVLQLFRESLMEGHAISHAMRKAPRVFDPVTVNLIEAAEAAGTLEEALRDLSESIKRDMAFTDQIRSSLLYPAFVFTIFILVLLLILLFVVPRIAQVFLGLRVELPAPTMALIAISQFLLKFYPYLLAALVAAVIGFVVLFRAHKRYIINLLLNLPLLKTLGRFIDLTRFNRSMHQLLKAGVPVAEALDLSKRVVNKQEIATAIDRMQKSVSEGKPLSEGLRTPGRHVIPPIMMHILETAERTGTLEKTMAELAEFAETQVTRRLKAITTLIEPVLIVAIAVFVGGMMLAIIAPIYNIISQISGR